jgi:hypothetical protein
MKYFNFILCYLFPSLLGFSMFLSFSYSVYNIINKIEYFDDIF